MNDEAVVAEAAERAVENGKRLVRQLSKQSTQKGEMMTIIYATIFLTIFYRKLAKHAEFD